MTAFVESRLAVLYQKYPWLSKDPLPGKGRVKNMEAYDALPASLRECVHEYGYPIVAALHQQGITKASVVHHLVREIWDGARGFNTDGPSANARTGPAPVLDWLLVNSGSSLHAGTIARALWQRGFVIVPRDPSTGMIEASKATVSNFDQLVTKTDKHKRRLKAALEQYASAYWPSLSPSTNERSKVST